MNRSIILLIISSILLIEVSTYLVKARSFETAKDIPESLSKDGVDNKLAEPEVLPEVNSNVECLKPGQFVSFNFFLSFLVHTVFCISFSILYLRDIEMSL